MSGKFGYWTGHRLFTTSNGQITAGVVSSAVAATRAKTDTYVRSFWWAQVSYASDGSQPVPGWWGAARVTFAAQVDIPGTLASCPDITSGEPDDRICAVGMFPTRYSEPEFAPSYDVVWTSPPNGVESTGQRKGNGVNFPRVVATLRCADQNGFFAGAAEPAYILRASIWGRVLWLSDVGP